MDHSIMAGELFLGGCNCAQAVFLAFSDVTGIDRKTAARLSSPSAAVWAVCGRSAVPSAVCSWCWATSTAMTRLWRTMRRKNSFTKMFRLWLLNSGKNAAVSSAGKF